MRIYRKGSWWCIELHTGQVWEGTQESEFLDAYNQAVTLLPPIDNSEEDK